MLSLFKLTATPDVSRNDIRNFNHPFAAHDLLDPGRETTCPQSPVKFVQPTQAPSGGRSVRPLDDQKPVIKQEEGAVKRSGRGCDASFVDVGVAGSRDVCRCVFDVDTVDERPVVADEVRREVINASLETVHNGRPLGLLVRLSESNLGRQLVSLNEPGALGILSSHVLDHCLRWGNKHLMLTLPEHWDSLRNIRVYRGIR